MLLSVKFAYVDGSAEREISEGEGDKLLMPCSTMLRLWTWAWTCQLRGFVNIWSLRYTRL